ncbi:unnamed protein product [Rodentolepis nana]|uniref:Uncharacterized protein n=1 Tax=Rodentolepis nana TaxID=102285 RepID=A0A3P7SXJ5_RODNA|nr:unnamed protein product [Rodentolepis nana]
MFGGTFSLPHNFERTAPIYKPGDKVLKKQELVAQSQADSRQQKQAFFSNPQTELLCAMLELTNPNAVLLGQASYNLSEMANMLVERGELDEDDDNDGCGVEPSPAKLARVDSNPEEINLDDLDVDDEEENANNGGIVEGYEPGVVPVNDVDYNPQYLAGCELPSASEYYPEGATVSAIEVQYSPNPIYTSEVSLTEGNEYNPEPLVKNPEVIDIDNLIDDDDDEASADNGPQEEYEPGGVKLEVSYNPQPFIEEDEQPTKQEDAGQDEGLTV